MATDVDFLTTYRTEHWPFAFDRKIVNTKLVDVLIDQLVKLKASVRHANCSPLRGNPA